MRAKPPAAKTKGNCTPFVQSTTCNTNGSNLPQNITKHEHEHHDIHLFNVHLLRLLVLRAALPTDRPPAAVDRRVLTSMLPNSTSVPWLVTTLVQPDLLLLLLARAAAPAPAPAPEGAAMKAWVLEKASTNIAVAVASRERRWRRGMAASGRRDDECKKRLSERYPRIMSLSRGGRCTNCQAHGAQG